MKLKKENYSIKNYTIVVAEDNLDKDLVTNL